MKTSLSLAEARHQVLVSQRKHLTLVVDNTTPPEATKRGLKLLSPPERGWSRDPA